MKNIILGIETSCDDTAIALIDTKGKVLSSVISSQFEVHSKFGGIYPEFAAREHITSILPVINESFKKANVKPDYLKAIGVTRGPGLISSLLVGINTAIGLGLGWNKPVIGINHLRGHLRSADLEEQRVKYPAVILLVSGGHTILAYMESTTDIKILGSTRDDSVGEAYDKVGRMLGLGYPGGPAVDKMAFTGKPTIPFPRPLLQKKFEFSFSGLKSAVARYMPSTTSENYPNVAASFVRAVMDVLIKKSYNALKAFPAKSLVVVGGVAASPQLRSEAEELSKKMGVELCLPPLRWATDNAAMIALATLDYINLGHIIEPIPQLNLSLNDF